MMKAVFIFAFVVVASTPVIAIGGAAGPVILLAEDDAAPGPAGVADGLASGDWFGLRSRLARRGVTVDVELVADWSRNLSGGLRRGSVLRQPLRVALTLDTMPLLGWAGGRLHASANVHEGTNASEILVGDLQGFDNLDAPPLRQVSELWLEQSLLGGRLRLRAGKSDANSEFAAPEGASDFLSSSAGFSPTIQGMPSYPDPAAGLSLFGRPARWADARLGVYDGATNEGCHGRTGNRGPSTLWGRPDALFLVAEGGLRWAPAGGLDGRLALGAWKHTGRFAPPDGGADRGSAGSYLVLDQRLWRESTVRDSGEGVALFVQLGRARARVGELDRHVGAGLRWTGALPGRNQDSAGVYVSAVRLGVSAEDGRSSRRETAFEVFYRLQLRPWLTVQPDVQYIARPGGRAGHAAVASARAEVAF